MSAKISIFAADFELNLPIMEYISVIQFFEDSCGKVKIVEHFEDVKVKIVDNFEDIKIKIVEHFEDVKK